MANQSSPLVSRLGKTLIPTILTTTIAVVVVLFAGSVHASANQATTHSSADITTSPATKVPATSTPLPTVPALTPTSAPTIIQTNPPIAAPPVTHQQKPVAPTAKPTVPPPTPVPPTPTATPGQLVLEGSNISTASCSTGKYTAVTVVNNGQQPLNWTVLVSASSGTFGTVKATPSSGVLAPGASQAITLSGALTVGKGTPTTGTIVSLVFAYNSAGTNQVGPYASEICH